MDSLTVRAAVHELNAHQGSRLDEVRSAEVWELHLVLDRRSTLVLCAHPRHNALYAAAGPPGPADVHAPTREASFVRNAQRLLAGGRFHRAVQRGLDRVVALAFRKRDRWGEIKVRHVIGEMTGTRANVLLVEGNDPWRGAILDVLRRDRSRGAGASYRPPAMDKADSTSASRDALVAAVRRALREAGGDPRVLVGAFSGVSPFVATEIWNRMKAEERGDPERLTDAWLAFARDTEPGAEDRPAGRLFSPVAVTLESGSSEVLCFRPKAGMTSVVPHGTISEAAAAVHRAFRGAASGERRSPRLTAVRQAERRVLNALDALRREEEESRNAEELRRMGEALLASAHAVAPGDSGAEVPDPHSGGTTQIRLNPRLSASENAKLYFRRARKAERRQALLGRRRSELESRREGLQRLAEETDRATSPEAEAAWFREARRLGVKLPRTELDRDPGARPEDRLPSALRPRRFALGGGWEILVGKSNRGNEVLTHEIARPHDTWMHADQAAGSHAVLRHHEKGKEPPRAVVLAAAAITAYFSRARTASKVPVLVTQKRFVRRARKARAGTVTVGQHETIMVRPATPDQMKES
jgi:predicted ribosome quality control (RQC) complex YloA/Tae2 family protein